MFKKKFSRCFGGPGMTDLVVDTPKSFGLAKQANEVRE